MLGKYARPKAKRVTKLSDYRVINYVSECSEWAKLENDNGIYKVKALVVLTDSETAKLLKAREEIRRISENKA